MLLGKRWSLVEVTNAGEVGHNQMALSTVFDYKILKPSQKSVLHFDKVGERNKFKGKNLKLSLSLFNGGDFYAFLRPGLLFSIL